MKSHSKLKLFALALVLVALTLPTVAPRASELVNHTYHWYRLFGTGDHHIITRDGHSTKITVTFHCGFLCHNYWTIHPHHTKSRPGKAGWFSATPHWGDGILRYVDGLPGVEGIKAAFIVTQSCTGSVGKHKEEGIASQVYVTGIRSGGVKLYC